MTQSLRILVADDEADMREYFQRALPAIGHQVVGVASTGAELVALCRDLEPDLVITDIKMPDLDGIDAAKQVYQERAVPFILVSAYHEPELLERAEQEQILAYLVKPIKQADLEPAIAMAMYRYQQFKGLQLEASGLRQALEDRKVIERAKGILMMRANLSEPDAFRRLQKLARDQNRKLVDIAMMIVTAEKALQPTV
jgi:response regulator NasT